MKIQYNDTYQLDVDLERVSDKDLYRLVLNKIDTSAKSYTSMHEFYFEKKQLKQFVDYLNGATDGIL